MARTICVLVATLASCDAPATSSGNVQELVDMANKEDGFYVQGTQAATTLQAMRAETGNHELRMSSLLGDMRSELGLMMGRCAQMQPMLDLRSAMMDELASHTQTMYAETELAPARQEVARHVDVMGMMLGDLGSTYEMSGCRP